MNIKKLGEIEFSDEERRIYINFEQLYENWIEQERDMIKNYSFGLHWKNVGGKKYLCKKENGMQAEKSLGPENIDNLKYYNEYISAKEEKENYIEKAKQSLGELIRQYRLLKLPSINPTAGKILRELDKNELLGTQYLVVGTVAFPVYALHASKKYHKEFISTLDFDLTWFDKNTDVNTFSSGGLLKILKKIDSQFNLNFKKPYQAKNAAGYEVELLCAPSVYPILQKKEKNFNPIPMLEQEWLRNGNPIRHIVLDENNIPTPIVSPDPRWMAFHKLWLSEKPERSALKKPKDKAQADLLLNLLIEKLYLEYPLDIDFVQDLPSELRPLFDSWCEQKNYVPSNSKNKIKW